MMHMSTRQIAKDETVDIQIVEMADAHSHIDLINDWNIVKSAISMGVRTIVTNGVDTKSNMRCIELADMKNIFSLIGIDPEHSNVDNKELDFNIGLVKQNSAKVTGIGEIGLDYGRVKESVPIARQKIVFGKFLDLARDLNMPVSVHSRDALSDVVQMLEERKMQRAHIHFFEGSAQQAKEIERKGYMISVPPLKSSKRSKVIKEIAIDNIMAESDSPVVGASPKDVERSIAIVAEAKGMDFKKTAEILTDNTKRFFGIKNNASFMRF
jgi:TatD DNase family protein